ncbi:anti-sigma factor family protein [Streptomyces spinosirectus]
MKLGSRRRDTAERQPGCRKVIHDLQAYLDGETDEATGRRVKAHLDDCRDCGLEADRYRKIKYSLARLGQPDACAVARLRRFGESLLHTGPDAWDMRMPSG